MRRPTHGQAGHAERAALLVDEVLSEEPMRQWVLSLPYQLRFLLAQQPAMMGKVLKIVYRTLATHLINKAGFNSHTAHIGAVTLIQRLAGPALRSALNLSRTRPDPNAAQFISTYCFWMAFTPWINTASCAFTVSRRLPLVSSMPWCINSVIAWLDFWRKRAGCNEMLITPIC
jgi:hypothetical protein